MKTTLHILTGMLLILGAATTGHATPEPADPFLKTPPAAPPAPDSKEPAPWKNVLVTVEAYSMDRSVALAMLAGEAKNAARYEKVRELAKNGQAALEVLQAAVTKSGTKALLQSADEVSYWNRFYQPLVRNGNPVPVPATERRKIGDELEISPTLTEDGRFFSAEILLKRTLLAGFHDVGAATDFLPVTLPTFQVQLLSTSVNGPCGAPEFLGSFTPPNLAAASDASAKEWLCFMRVDAYGPASKELKVAKGGEKPGDLSLTYVCYSLEREAAREILAKPASLASAWEGLQPLLAEGRARVEISSSVRTPSGRRVAGSGLQEILSPSDYNLPRLPELVAKGDARDSEIIQGAPSEFGAREVGFALEVETVLGADGRSLDVNQAPRLTTNFGMLEATGSGKKYPSQPIFTSQSMISQVTIVASGGATLLGTFNPPGADGVNGRADSGRTWLLFVQGSVVSQ
jgi:hypothetical protein